MSNYMDEQGNIVSRDFHQDMLDGESPDERGIGKAPLQFNPGRPSILNGRNITYLNDEAGTTNDYEPDPYNMVPKLSCPPGYPQTNEQIALSYAIEMKKLYPNSFKGAESVVTDAKVYLDFLNLKST